MPITHDGVSQKPEPHKYPQPKQTEQTEQRDVPANEADDDPFAELSDEEVEALYEKFLAEHPEKTQQVQPIQQHIQSDDNYGEYRRVQPGEQEQPKENYMDKLSDLRYVLAPHASKLAILGVVAIVAIFILVGYKAYINKVTEVVTPTTAPVSAPVEQPVQPVQAQPFACNLATTKVVSLTDAHDNSQGYNYCAVSLENGSGTSVYGTCASQTIYRIGDEVYYCK